MAILPRTLLTQPAPAAVAAISLLGFTIIGMAAHEQVERGQLHARYTAPCTTLEQELGPRQFWQHGDYVRYAACFDEHGDQREVIAVATEGLQAYPKSQVLYNLKGYHAIGLHEFELATETLERGLAQVPEQSNGVMENNLAWSYLWTQEGGTERARALYESSLDRESTCETLHTGMFVEFEIARTSDGIEQAEALRNFQSLRNRYQDCENRDASWNTLVEAAGAAVLYDEVEGLMGTPWDQRGLAMTMRVTVKQLRAAHPSASVTMLCSEAMPLPDLHARCVDDVQNALNVTKR